MNITLNKEDHYWCNGCDEWVKPWATTENTYYWHNESERVSIDGYEGEYDYIFAEGCGTFEVRTCDACDTAIDEDDFVDRVYVCGECDGTYRDRQEAVECCR